ncbi:MAG: hypothetical protein HC767_08420 [Akkermansiaceae bacterium]|nr:hypothetical protein [Akkermansiaceae bacterium]
MKKKLDVDITNEQKKHYLPLRGSEKPLRECASLRIRDSKNSRQDAGNGTLEACAPRIKKEQTWTLSPSGETSRNSGLTSPAQLRPAA